MVAMPMIVTVAMRMPATITGSASGSSTRKRIWRSVKSHPAGRVFGLRRDGVEARDGVADQDQERVGDEGDDDGRGPDGHARYGDEDSEERETRYGVEDARNEGDRRVGLAVAGREYADLAARWRGPSRPRQTRGRCAPGWLALCLPRSSP